MGARREERTRHRAGRLGVVLVCLAAAGALPAARDPAGRRAPDAGVPDAGRRDAGAAVEDTGAEDAGTDAGWPPGCLAAPRWQPSDEDHLLDGGYTDLVELPVGGGLPMEFRFLVHAFFCDQRSVAEPRPVELTEAAVRFELRGHREGTTECALLRGGQGERRRYFRVEVKPGCQPERRP